MPSLKETLKAKLFYVFKTLEVSYSKEKDEISSIQPLISLIKSWWYQIFLLPILLPRTAPSHYSQPRRLLSVYGHEQDLHTLLPDDEINRNHWPQSDQFRALLAFLTLKCCMYDLVSLFASPSLLIHIVTLMTPCVYKAPQSSHWTQDISFFSSNLYRHRNPSHWSQDISFFSIHQEQGTWRYAVDCLLHVLFPLFRSERKQYIFCVVRFDNLLTEQSYAFIYPCSRR